MADSQDPKDNEVVLNEFHPTIQNVRNANSISDVSLFGLGGTGTLILLHWLHKLRKSGENIDNLDYYFYDLSEDVDRYTGNYVLTQEMPDHNKWITQSNIICGLRLGGGAAGTPQVAEAVTSWLSSTYKSFFTRNVSIYFHSLSGGTGSGSLPIILQNTSQGFKLVFSILSNDEMLDLPNQLRNFPKINQFGANTGILNILVENEAIQKKQASFTNVDFLDNLSEIRGLDAYCSKPNYMLVNDIVIRLAETLRKLRIAPKVEPKNPDWRDLTTKMGATELLEDGICSIVPFLWPLDYDYFPTGGRELSAYVKLALEEGCLCNGLDLGFARSVFLIIEAPVDSLTDAQKERAVNSLEQRLRTESREGISPKVQLYTVPENSGVRVCIFISPPAIKRIADLSNLSDRDLRTGWNGWKQGIRQLIQQMPDVEEFVKSRVRPIPDLETSIRELTNIVDKNYNKEVGSSMLNDIQKMYKAIFNTPRDLE